MSELPDTVFVRFADVVRWSGLSRPTVAKFLRRCRRVVPLGLKRGLYARDEVVAAFEGKRLKLETGNQKPGKGVGR